MAILKMKDSSGNWVQVPTIKGEAGTAAGFGTPTYSIDANIGEPSVTITASGADTAKVFNFDFKNLKGEKGEKGDTVARNDISVSSTMPLSSTAGDFWYKIVDDDYLYFMAAISGSKIALTKVGNPSWTGYYSFDKSTWTQYIPGTTGNITLQNRGDIVYFKGTYTAANDANNYLKFTMSSSGAIYSGGNIMSFCSSTNFSTNLTLPYAYVFYKLFEGCTALISPPELPATTLTASCYKYMFDGCTNLYSAPMLPATTLTESCYHGMFENIVVLEQTPILPATNLAQSCYAYMFYGISGLKTITSLPATTLYDSCYEGMFAECPSITNIPKLKATTLATDCYYGMFSGCTSLYISDSTETGSTKQIKIPYSGTFTNTHAQQDMFTSCLGTRASNTMAGATGQSYTYYTQKEPI